MEYLSRLLHKAVANHKDFAYYLYCSKVKLNHLLFADDLMLFSKADPDTLSIVLRDV